VARSSTDAPVRTDGADAPLFGLDRRRFLQLSGGAGLGLAVAGSLPFAGQLLRPAAAAGVAPEDRVDTWTTSTCQFCATGCGLQIGTAAGTAVMVRGAVDHPVNQGLLCQKSLHQAEVLRAPGRLADPLLRDGDALRAVSWERALEQMVARLRATIAEHGPASVAIYNTGQLLQEEFYTLSKLARGAIKTPNLDGNPRLCMASAVTGYQRSFGTDGPPSCYDDLAETDLVYLTGANLHEAHPILGGRLMARLARGGCKLVVADPRAIQFAQLADLYLPIRPGTDVALLNAMQHVLVRDGFVDRRYVEAHTTGFDELAALVADTPPSWAAPICGVPAADIETAARWFGEADAALSLWTMGINQQTRGTAAVNQLCNLHLLTGQLGRPGAGPFSITGQPSSMDFRQAGGGGSLPGYRSLAKPEHRQQIADAWGIDVADLPEAPVSAPRIWECIEAGEIRFLWVIGTNPAVTFPDTLWATEVLRSVDTLVVQDVFETETTDLADVVLPAAMWGEKSGTFTNSERRVNVLRQAVAPHGRARSDFDIFVEVGHRLGYGELFPFQSTEDAFDEFKALTEGRPCDLRGITYDRLEAAGGLQWPVPHEGHPGTPRLYTDGRFNTEDGRAVLHAMPYEPPMEEPDEAFPFWLNTGRVQEHWHAMSKTGRIPAVLKRSPESYVEVNPTDAERLGIRSGQRVRLRSRRGEMELAARVTAKVAPGSLFVPMHFGPRFGSRPVNDLTGRFFDEFSSQPALKHTAATIEKV
jgi:ferredoxin-nitrate reductase